MKDYNMSIPHNGVLCHLNVDSNAGGRTLMKWLPIYDNAESADVLKMFWPGGAH